MHTKRPISVVILYTHPLLGEGLARLLSAEPGLVVIAIEVCSIEQAETAIAAEPDVIIYERHDAARATDLLCRAPGALVIDVGLDTGPSFSYQREEIGARPDAIVRAIRGMRERSSSQVPGKAAPTPVAAADRG